MKEKLPYLHRQGNPILNRKKISHKTALSSQTRQSNTQNYTQVMTPVSYIVYE